MAAIYGTAADRGPHSIDQPAHVICEMKITLNARDKRHFPIPLSSSRTLVLSGDINNIIFPQIILLSQQHHNPLYIKTLVPLLPLCTTLLTKAVFIRAKRVTGPLDSAAQARLCGLGYCGSANSCSSDNGSLSDLVHDFLESSSYTSLPDVDSDADSTSDGAATLDVVPAALGPLAERNPFLARLLNAARTLAGVGPSNPGGLYRRAVMAGLRAAGYNAGLCKARWDVGGGVTTGAHEYVDVVVVVSTTAPTMTRRYIVDVEFAAEFEIARPTAEYARVLAALPRVVVARPDEVKRAVRAVAEAAQRSLRMQGLSVPPWRKGRYMQAKWTAPYRRTTNVLPGGGGIAGEVKCRAVGFHAGPGLVGGIR